MRIRSRLVECLIPLLVVGAAALGARLLYSDESGTPAIYLVPLGLAVMTGLWRPGLWGSLGGWLGWSGGLALAWLIATGEIPFAGSAEYGVITALLPHVAGSTVRVLLGSRVGLAR
jgi:hypothetical protein